MDPEIGAVGCLGWDPDMPYVEVMMRLYIAAFSLNSVPERSHLCASTITTIMNTVRLETMEGSRSLAHVKQPRRVLNSGELCRSGTAYYPLYRKKKTIRELKACRKILAIQRLLGIDFFKTELSSTSSILAGATGSAFGC